MALCYTHADFGARRDRGPPCSLSCRPAGGQVIGRVDVSESASISSGIAERYATAVFSLAQEENQIERLETDLDNLEAALADSPDFGDMLRSPVYSRAAQQAAVTAVADGMGLSDMLKNTLALMASKRRLFVLPPFVAQLREMIAAHKGEVTAEIASAQPLSDEQMTRLSDTLARQVGKRVKIETTVDESLIGGLVVKVGSRMIDTSIRAKLAALQNAMKEVG